MLKYLSYYGNENCKEKRYYVLAATNKVDYISQAIRSNNMDIEIISVSPSVHKKASSYSMQTKYGVPVLMTPSLSKKNKFTSLINRFYIKKWLKKQLNKLTEKDQLIVYHSLGYIKTIERAKQKKNFKLILEIEEIYSDVTGNQKMREEELKFFEIADAYIFSTELLNQKVNIQNKPSVIIYGTYNVEKQIAEKCNDGRIHCVYAGTFDPRKGGVFAAVAAGEFLNENYHIHIIGFGDDYDKNLLINTINDISKNTKCRITYDGLLSGEEYIKFIQSCDIGLSTQNPEAAFNATSFPSKVLSYMANGLRVVSVKIDAVENSQIGDIVYYYDKQTPQEIAEAIQSVAMRAEYDSRKKIRELDGQFKKEIMKVLA